MSASVAHGVDCGFLNRRSTVRSLRHHPTNYFVLAVSGRHRCSAGLFVPNRVRPGVPEADGRNSDRLAPTRCLTAIALQVEQSLWRRRTPASLEIIVPRQRQETNDELETRRQWACECFPTEGACDHAYVCDCASRQRHVGRRHPNNIPIYPTQRNDPMTSITTKDGVQIFYQDWGTNRPNRSSSIMAGR
jgi:hypothetical protein